MTKTWCGFLSDQRSVSGGSAKTNPTRPKHMRGKRSFDIWGEKEPLLASPAWDHFNMSHARETGGQRQPRSILSDSHPNSCSVFFENVFGSYALPSSFSILEPIFTDHMFCISSDILRYFSTNLHGSEIFGSLPSLFGTWILKWTWSYGFIRGHALFYQ